MLLSFDTCPMAPKLDKEILARNVREIRQRRGLTSAELSRTAGLDRSYVSSIENASRSSYPKLVTIEKLARALRVSPEHLMGPRTFEVSATPYDRLPQVRRLVDRLAALSPADHALATELLSLFADALAASRGQAATATRAPSRAAAPMEGDSEYSVNGPGERR